MNIFGKIVLSLLITSNVLVFSVSSVNLYSEKRSESKINKINMFLNHLAEEAPEVLNELKSYLEASFILDDNLEDSVVHDVEPEIKRSNSILDEDDFFKFMVCFFQRLLGIDFFDN